jgi:hypothetical protein
LTDDAAIAPPPCTVHTDPAIPDSADAAAGVAVHASDSIVSAPIVIPTLAIRSS